MAVRSRPLVPHSPDSNSPELVQRLRWVIGLRWAFALALFVVGAFRTTLPGDPQHIKLAHFVLAAIVACYNLGFWLVSRQPGFAKSGAINVVRYGQVPVDLLVITALLHFSGGITAPVFILYFVYVFVSLAVLPPSGAYWVSLTAAVCYGTLAIAEARSYLPPPAGHLIGIATALAPAIYLGYVLTISATLVITAYIANYFASILTKDERTIREQLGNMNTLYFATRKMSGALSTDEVMRTLVALGMELSNANTGSLLLLSDRGDPVFAAMSGFTPDEEKRAAELSRHEPEALRRICRLKNGVYAPDVDAVDGLRPVLPRVSTRSFYAKPLVSDDRLIGTLNLSFDRATRLPDSTWKLIEAVNQQAALALERARLFADAERAAREMAGLYHIGLVTTSSLQTDEVLRLIYEQVNRVFHPDTFYIGLYDEDQGELSFDIFVEGGEFLPPFRTRLLGGVCAYVIRNRRPVFVSNWSAEIEQLPFEAGVVGVPTESVLSVPLMAKSKMVGVMSVQGLQPNQFDHEHLRLLTSIAGQAALALENAKLHAQVFEQAQRDPLTGVYNHGSFIDKLQNRVRETVGDSKAVALIMLDIDRFKQYNDTYGHMVGDDVLRSIVVSIQNHLKSTDVVGRWGGEEFGIVLPDVTRAQAFLVAERIRQTAMRATLIDMHNRHIPSPTVSQGIAMYPDDATNVEELIDKADSALYRAKDQGRNQIAEWVELDPQRPINLRARG